MGLDDAIAALQAEVDEFHQGTKTQPAPGTAVWFLLRAKALGLSQLKRMKQMELHRDPALAEAFYRKCSKTFKRDELEVGP